MGSQLHIGKATSKVARQPRVATLAILMEMLEFSIFLRNWSHQSAIQFGKITEGRCGRKRKGGAKKQ
jgi:hypothetical protein